MFLQRRDERRSSGIGSDESSIVVENVEADDLDIKSKILET